MPKTHVDLSTIEHLCGLARLTLTADEKNALVPELAAILAHVDSLAEVDMTDGDAARSPELASATGPTGSTAPTAWRADEEVPGLSRDMVMSAAPATDDGCFLVPTFVEGA